MRKTTDAVRSQARFPEGAPLSGDGLRLYRFLEENPDACVILDGELRYLYFNKAAASLLHLSLSEMIGKPLSLLSQGPDAYERLEKYKAVLADGVPRSFDAIKPDGVSGEQVFRIRVFKVGDGLGFVWTETTESVHMSRRLVSAQEELRALTAHLVEVREEERKALARELHDELGQALTAIEMELRHLARSRGEFRGGGTDRIGELLYLTNQSIRAVQRICSELRPAILDRLGLRTAIEWLAEDYASRSSLNVSTELEARENSIGPKASTALFRIAQEAMLNIVRHARAKSVEISLRESDSAVVLSVEDDGIGISEAQAASPDSFGIQGIRERARPFGGMASIEGVPGRGTRLWVALPFAVDGRLP
jgi:two-component system, NarL family, sensor histidine kinase UhpB